MRLRTGHGEKEDGDDDDDDEQRGVLMMVVGEEEGRCLTPTSSCGKAARRCNSQPDFVFLIHNSHLRRHLCWSRRFTALCIQLVLYYGHEARDAAMATEGFDDSLDCEGLRRDVIMMHHRVSWPTRFDLRFEVIFDL